MNKQNVIAIFDVGKTNKKLVLFDEQYKLVYEESKNLEEIKDEDGFACEDVNALTSWLKKAFDEITRNEQFEIKAVNFSGYGASFVYIGKDGNVVAPLYNYLKPFPEKLSRRFYDTYGGESLISRQTASPVLGNLNSGMQLYRMKYETPQVFKKIAFALHLPQYLSYVLAGSPATDITSIGCHTKLWDFNEQKYHYWVSQEGIESCFAPIFPCTSYVPLIHENKNYVSGLGLHDSSAALIPYFAAFSEPFILLSTGTWCISLNPFNHSLLSDDELHQDCLCYLSYEGKPVKASRLFAGYEHEQQVKRLAAHYNTENDYYKTVKYDVAHFKDIQHMFSPAQLHAATAMVQQSGFKERDLNNFKTYEEAYHRLILDIVMQQVRSTKIVLEGTPVKRIFVDGGFSQNPVYMHLLASAFPEIEVFAANIPQASALGAALAMHEHWNKDPMPVDLINVKHFKAASQMFL